MHTIRLILLYMLAAVIVVVLGGLVGWYFFLHVPQKNEETTDAARGLVGHTSISFSGGSTERNISAVVTGGGFQTATGTASTTVSSSPLWQVDNTPVAGMGFVKTATTTALRYVERANGYVFAADPSRRSTTRLTETLMPKIYEALIAPGGSIVEHSIDDAESITTFVGTLIATSSSADQGAPYVLKGSYLAKNIQAMTLNPATQSLFYIVPNGTSGIDGMTAQAGGAKPKKLFSSTITHWTPLWLSDGHIVVTINSADGLPGYGYSVANDGTMTLLLGNVPGLTLLPHPSSKMLLYGSSAQGALTLFIQGVASSTPLALDIHTVADKCVWLESKSLIVYCAVPKDPPTGNFLDEWYRGAVHTSDSWWKIDLQNNVTMQIYSPKSTDGANLDVERPVIDPGGNYIAFINASDQSLWTLKIPQ